jgi:hypothetical protein
MAFSRVGTNVKTTFASGASFTLAFPSGNTAGNMIVLCFLTNSNVSVSGSITDSQGNTYSAAVNQFNAGAEGLMSIFYVTGIVGGGSANTITVNFSADSGGGEISAQEYNPGSGATVSLESSGTSTGSGSGGSLATGNYSTSQANDLEVVWAAGDGSTLTAGATGTPGNWSKWNADPDAFTSAADSLSNSSSSTNTGTYTQSSVGAWGIVAAAWKAVGGSTLVTLNLIQGNSDPTSFQPNMVSH